MSEEDIDVPEPSTPEQADQSSEGGDKQLEIQSPEDVPQQPQISPSSRKPPPVPPAGARRVQEGQQKSDDPAEEKKRKQEAETVSYYLRQALQAKDAKACETLVKKAGELGMSGELVDQAKAWMDELASERRVTEIETLRHYLKQGIELKNKEMLNIALDKVDELSKQGSGAARMNSEFYELVSKGRKELARYDQEDASTAAAYLKQAIQLRDRELLQRTVEKAEKFRNSDLLDKELLSKAQGVLRELDAEHLIKSFLKQAIEAKDSVALEDTLKKASALKMSGDIDEVKRASKLYEELKKKSLKKAKKDGKKKEGKELFGAPLSVAVKANGEAKQLPLVCEETIEFLRTRGLSEPGLFRISGNKENMETLERKYSGQEPVVLTDVHDAAGILKIYLRKLPEPLIPFSHYPAFIRAGEKPKDPARIPLIKDLVTKLPTENKALLTYLMGFLKSLADNSARNKMTPENLAIVFAPNLIRPAPQNENPTSMMVEMPISIGLVATMISNHDEIFCE
jgi:hypothetical protein